MHPLYCSMVKIRSQIQHPCGFLCVYQNLCPSLLHSSCCTNSRIRSIYALGDSSFPLAIVGFCFPSYINYIHVINTKSVVVRICRLLCENYLTSARVSCISLKKVLQAMLISVGVSPGSAPRP